MALLLRRVLLALCDASRSSFRHVDDTKMGISDHTIRLRIGVNSTVFGAYFELKKCALCALFSVKAQVELRRLGNQLPVLGKANSLSKLVCLPVC